MASTVTLKRPWVVEDDIPAGHQAKKLPVVLSKEEVARFLGAVDNLKHRSCRTGFTASGTSGSSAIVSARGSWLCAGNCSE